MIPIIFATAATFTTVKNELLPLVLVALLLDGVLLSVWYILGALLNNSGVKESAKGEFYQLAGTAILAVIIVGTVGIFANLFSSSLSGTIMSSSNINTLCNNIETTTQLDIINGGTFSFLGGTSGAGGLFPGLCSYVSTSGGTLTDKLDYPLAASGVIIANLTNQTANNLNSFYIIDMYLGYLKGLSPTAAFCLQVPNPAPTGPCVIPPEELITPDALLMLEVEETPLAGYSMVYDAMRPIGTLMATSLESFIAQLSIIALLLYAWPYLIFVGLLFRALPFTRKIGGLFIAIGIGAIIIFPTVFAIEYLSLGQGLGASTIGGSTTSNIASAYGFNSVSSNSLFELPTLASSGTLGIGATIGPNYVTNFYVEPSIEAIGLSNNCWPPAGSVLAAVAGDTLFLITPGLGTVAGVLSFLRGALGFVLPSSLPSLLVPFGAACTPAGVSQTLFMILNAYGIIGVVAYWLPLINIIITFTAITGLSGLFGGDTELAGLAKIL